MKAKELIEKLKKIDPESKVCVRGYEGGIDEIDLLQEIGLIINVNTEYYYGKHEIFQPNNDQGLSNPDEKGVLLT